VIVVIGLAAAFAPWLTQYGFEQMDLTARLQAPSAQHWFGTDHFGRDIFSRVLYGGRASLLVSIAAVIVSLIVGTLLGAVAAFKGGWLDEAIMRVMDVIMAFPYIVLAITLVIVLEPGLATIIVVIAAIRVPHFARITRGAALTVMNQEYVTAARAVGQRDCRILLSHILPNCVTPIIVMASLSAGTAITTEASLSFLGLGVQPPMSSWGTMIFDGTRNLTTAPWTTAFAGIALTATVLGLNLVGDGLRDALDPRLRRI
jgi:peptide/nickel transport system permease protein